jgi:hypothetical protein
LIAATAGLRVDNESVKKSSQLNSRLLSMPELESTRHCRSIATDRHAEELLPVVNAESRKAEVSFQKAVIDRSTGDFPTFRCPFYFEDPATISSATNGAPHQVAHFYVVRYRFLR